MQPLLDVDSIMSAKDGSEPAVQASGDTRRSTHSQPFSRPLVFGGPCGIEGGSPGVQDSQSVWIELATADGAWSDWLQSTLPPPASCVLLALLAGAGCRKRLFSWRGFGTREIFGAGGKHSDHGSVPPLGRVESAILEAAAAVRSAVDSAARAAARGAGYHLAHVASVARGGHVSLEAPARNTRKAASW